MFNRNTPNSSDYERDHRHLSVSDLATAWGCVAISFVAIFVFG